MLQYEISEIGIGRAVTTEAEPSSNKTKGFDKGGLKVAPIQSSTKLIVKVYTL